MGRMDIRGDDQLIERIKLAARKDKRSLNSFVLLAMEAAADKMLGEEQPPEVHASAPVKEVAKKVLPEPTPEAEMEPQYDYWTDDTGKLWRSLDGQPYAEYKENDRWIKDYGD